MLNLLITHSFRRLPESSLVYEKTCNVEYAVLDAVGGWGGVRLMNELDELKSFVVLFLEQ